MKKILYITNIQVPYRVRFFNQLSKECDLTVLYERSQPGNRDASWSHSIKENYTHYFLDGIKIGNESTFSLKIIRYLIDDYDEIVLGCYSTPVQMFANLFLRLIKKPFIMNFDGEIFADDKGFKTYMKKFFINGASKYLIAGEKAASSLRRIVDLKPIIPYYFSSLLKQELLEHEKNSENQDREEFALVVGQYYPYKGLDVAVEAARKLPLLKFKFVGMGKRTQEFILGTHANEMKNVEIIPFLQKKELEEEYKKCKILILPTRQECWGLVINEAASFGTPVVSTNGSGAAVEFLFDKYPFLLAEPGNATNLAEVIRAAWNMESGKQYSQYLIDKSKKYNIEHSVQCHLLAFSGVKNGEYII